MNLPYKILSANRVECKHCLTTHVVDRDEDGIPSLETTRCESEGCEVGMCGECVTRCFDCDRPRCSGHSVVRFERDTNGELRRRAYCMDCIREMESEAAA